MLYIITAVLNVLYLNNTVIEALLTGAVNNKHFNLKKIVCSETYSTFIN